MKEDRAAEVISKIISSAMNAIGDKPLRAVIEGERYRYEIKWENGKVEIKLNAQRL